MSTLNPEELRLLATRERQLLRVIFITLVGVVLLGLLSAGVRLPSSMLWVLSGAAFVALLLTFFRFLTAARLKAPWAYLLLVVALQFTPFPILTWLVVVPLVITVNRREFKSRGIRVGLLGPVTKA